ncbi:MAG: hypothetical protein HY789_11410 [Deltaproteobacteria bacterium]|nr:hypothetical protein [Deltaproteobacteria bacterium]
MTAWKMPPRAKIYEALTAVADQRVAITGPGTARVVSSSRDRTYDVEWPEDMGAITANDNASHWQGYIGYPIIAVLLVLGRLSANGRIAARLAGIPWKAVNDRFKRDYDKAIDHVLGQVAADAGSRAEIEQEVERIYAQLGSLGLQRAQPRRRPPREKRS